MSAQPLSRSRRTSEQRTFAIVASQYHRELVQALVTHAQAELAALSPASTVAVHEVPGAFEIPLVVEELATRGGVDAFIALGIIIQGETRHADLIGETITRSLQEISLRHRVPVIHEVLLVANAAQARARCLEKKLNRGVEAARVAAQMARVLAGIRAPR